MLESKIPTPQDFEETVQDLEFARKKVQLVHQIEIKTRAIREAAEQDQIKLKFEITKLEEQVEQLDLDKLKSIAS